MDSIYIETLSKKYPIKWAGISAIDNSLKIAIKESMSFMEAVNVFGDPEETQTITQFMDKTEMQKYEGYTDLKGITAESTNNMIITLAKQVQQEGEENADNN